MDIFVDIINVIVIYKLILLCLFTLNIIRRGIGRRSKIFFFFIISLLIHAAVYVGVGTYVVSMNFILLDTYQLSIYK